MPINFHLIQVGAGLLLQSVLDKMHVLQDGRFCDFSESWKGLGQEHNLAGATDAANRISCSCIYFYIAHTEGYFIQTGQITSVTEANVGSLIAHVKALA